MPTPTPETAAQRYARDYAAGMEASRKTRELTSQDVKRKSRLYVDNNVSAVTGGAPQY